MITINNDSINVSKSLEKYISCLHLGKALPAIGKNLVCVLSPCVDNSITSLCIYHELLNQNAYNPDIKCVIVSDDIITNSTIMTVYNNLIDSIQSSTDLFKNMDMIELIDPNNFLDQKETTGMSTKSRSLKKMDIDKRPILCVIDISYDVLQIIKKIDPDIVIFNNLSTHINLIISLIKNINMNSNKHTSIISLTNDEKKLNVIPKCHTYEIAYRTGTCFEKMRNLYHKLHIDIMKFNTNLIEELNTYIESDSDSDIDSDIDNSDIDTVDDENLDVDKTKIEFQIMKKLNACVQHVEQQILLMDDDCILTKKMVVLLESSIASERMYKYYKKNKCYYDCLSDVPPYNAMVNEDVINFSKISPHSIRLNNRSGILFVDNENIAEIISMTYNVVDNIDFLIILNDQFKNNINMYQRLVDTFVTNEIPNRHITYVELAENNLHQQLHRISKIFYDNDATNVQTYNELVQGIDSEMIRLDVEFNNIRQDKLERMFKITDADRRFDNRYNVIYIVPIPQSKLVTHNTLINYNIEKDILENNIDDDELVNEFITIANAKKGSRNIPKYSGAKWISRSDKIEIAGNKIGFAHEDTDTIEICEIIGIKEFTRRERRLTWAWKEKDCRGKNVLFLTSIKGIYKLSKFKKEMNIKKMDKISYMKEFQNDLGI